MQLPTTANHDATQPIAMRYTLVDVSTHPSGELGVYVEFEVDDKDFDPGKYTGFSMSFVGNPAPPSPHSGKPPIGLYVDAGSFDDETYVGAVRELEEHFAVGTGKL